MAPAGVHRLPVLLFCFLFLTEKSKRIFQAHARGEEPVLRGRHDTKFGQRARHRIGNRGGLGREVSTHVGDLSTLDYFWATACKTVRPMLSDRCLSVCPVCLSVTFVYCGQTVGWIKMKLGMQVGLDPGHIVLDGDPAPPPLQGDSHQFSANVRCGKTAGWTKMPLGMEVRLGPGNFVFDGDPAPQKK